MNNAVVYYTFSHGASEHTLKGFYYFILTIDGGRACIHVCHKVFDGYIGVINSVNI